MFFDTFTGSVEHTGAEKFLRKATCESAVFLRTVWINLALKVLKIPYFSRLDH